MVLKSHGELGAQVEVWKAEKPLDKAFTLVLLQTLELGRVSLSATPLF